MTPSELYRSEYLHMCRMACRILRDRDDAEDCVQTAFVRIWKAWESRRDPEHPQPWARSILYNTAMTILRERKSRGAMFQHVPIDEIQRGEPSVPSHESSVVARMTLQVAGQSLKEDEADAVNRWMAGTMPNTPTYKARAFRARRKMFAVLQ